MLNASHAVRINDRGVWGNIVVEAPSLQAFKHRLGYVFREEASSLLLFLFFFLFFFYAHPRSDPSAKKRKKEVKTGNISASNDRYRGLSINVS